MIAALSIGFVGTAVAVLLFVLVSDAAHRRTARGVATSTVGQSRWARFRRYRDAASERRAAAAGPPAVAKEVIRAMAHRAVYRLEEPRADDGEDEDDTGRWARRLLAGTCDKLDGYLPEALELERIADAFCGRANATCDTFEARLLPTFGGTRWRRFPFFPVDDTCYNRRYSLPKTSRHEMTGQNRTTTPLGSTRVFNYVLGDPERFSTGGGALKTTQRTRKIRRHACAELGHRSVSATVITHRRVI